ncbi:Uncharacterised protein [Canicola haemoglobinophilus]|uniref:Transferrin-binding protein B C-lobe/N-lobe beta barrel domain-containing protein n=1 Tax=Canicola haemoglobinophilus TaxID=733 RepID=A0AB38H7S5_9PAST|nr:hypothetical protein [Canicola haemoglobinophilus]STO53867.1 Uncharacterised protein [Canicola haemoglobinophilus]STO68400.1 Uncharacterised protein [Canicola haemoglobinophilus]
MNKNFKMTALAIMVSFGLTGCFISNDSSEDVKPATSISTKEEGKSDSKPTNEPKESTPTTQPEVPELPTNKEEHQPQPEPEKIVSVDSENNKWRIVKMNGYNGSLSNTVENQRDHYGATILTSPEICNLHMCAGNTMTYDSGVNATTKFDLDELAKQDNKPFLGVHSGSYSDNNLSGYVIDIYVNEGERIITKDEVETINYLFVNQPYSSYGMLYTNQNDIVSFHQGLRAGEKENTETEFDVYDYEIEQGQKTDRIIWNDNVKGTATYTGEVIAAISTYEPPYFVELRHIPKVDGTITLNASFGYDKDSSYITGGELNSLTIGKRTLPPMSIDPSSLHASGGISNSKDQLEGGYSAKFVGENLNDVIGEIGLKRGYDNVGKGGVIR